MLDFDLIKNVLVVAIGGSVITTAVVQKVKEVVNNKNVLVVIALLISLVIGTLFSMCFSDLSLVDGLWVGLITWVGADSIYKTFEDKIFTPFSKLHEVVEVPKENTKTLEDLEKEAEDE